MAIYKLNGQVLPEGQPVSLGGFIYPYSWLESASPSVLAANDIHKEGYEIYDPFYFFAPGIPRDLEDILLTGDHGAPVYVKVWDPETKQMVDTDKRAKSTGLKTVCLEKLKYDTNEILKPTDFYIIRNHAEDVEIPTSVAEYRAAVVTESARLQEAIPAVTTVEELIEVMSTIAWPKAE